MEKMAVGKVGEFNLTTGNWLAYTERMEMYFVANNIKEELKLPTLISLMGEAAYELLSSLACPLKPSALKYSEATNLLQEHLQPKPSVMAERYRFRQRRQLSGESIAEYVANLKKLSRFCGFKTDLEENLRDQFVCGLKSEMTRQRLFAEENLNYGKALMLATTLEAAERDAGAVESTVVSTEFSEGVNKININLCTVCGNANHKKWNCKYKEYQCSYCHQIGHLRRMCRKKILENYQQARPGVELAEKSFLIKNNNVLTQRGERQGSAGSRGGRGDAGARGRGGYSHGRAASTYWVTQSEDDSLKMHAASEKVKRSHYGAQSSDLECGKEEGDEPMYQMSLTQYKPVHITILVNDIFLKMEIDTGAPLSCISLDIYNKYFNNIMIKPCRIKLSFYDGSLVKPLGYIEINVKYKNVTKMLDLYIFNNGTTNLLGRQWLAELGIEIPKLCVNSLKTNVFDKDKIVNSIISRHKALFDETLGRFNGGTVSLCVRAGAQPVYCRARALPYALRDRVDAELDAMLAADVIEPVDRSDWATPLVIARKGDGGIRICADYKVTLNRVLMVDRYPVPKLDDLFSELSGQVWYTKLDLSQAYNQLELDESSRDYTVINTHRGLFKYKRLVYGLSSSPGIFQKFMSNLLKNIPNVLIFYDDILITNRDLETHLETIDKVLHILESNGLKIKRNKCKFLANEVKYLGFIISKNGLEVDKDKIEAIVSMPPPTNISELKSFLGMVNFYGKFLKNLSSSLSPLYGLLKKGKHFIWGKSQNIAFERVKKMLCSTEVLAHYDMNLETILTCDASEHGIGAILAQRESGGRERVVAYASRVLTCAEKHYSQIHKEALAIIFAVDKFHQYLYGRKFTLQTDHKPLVSIFGPNMGIPSTAASRLQRWAIKLSAYDFKIEFVNTTRNVADVLSRLIKSHKENTVNTEELPEQTYLHFATEALLLDYRQLKKETSSDPILCRVLSFIQDGWPHEVDIRELKPFFNRKEELYTELGCILWGHRVVIPSNCRDRVLKELHEPHMGIVKTKALARSYVWWPGVDEQVEAVCRACEVCATVAEAPRQQAPHSWPYPYRPWSRLHLDFLGPIAGLNYLIIVDSCSKWIEAINMTRTTSHAVIAVLRNIWARFGLPRQVVSDNATVFSSDEFRTFLRSNGIEQLFSAPYHPASNGAAENAVKICKRVIKKALLQKLNPDTALCRFLLSYRNTEHYTTGESPAKILLGRKLRMRLDVLKPDREARVQSQQAQIENTLGGAHRQMAPDDAVWYRNYRGPKKWVAGRVKSKLGSSDYTITSEFGTEVHRHVDQLKHRYELPVAGQSRVSSGRSSLGGAVTREVVSEGGTADSQVVHEQNEVQSPVSPGSADLAVKNDMNQSMELPIPNSDASCNKNSSNIPQCSRESPKALRNRQPPQRYGFD